MGGKFTSRAQFTASPGQGHYLAWRKRVIASLSDGTQVLIGLPGWRITVAVCSYNGVLQAAPRYLDAAAKSPEFAAFLHSVADAGLIAPVIHLDTSGNLIARELSAIVYERCCKTVLPAGAICLYRHIGQRGIDLSNRPARADARNYLVAVPDAEQPWRYRVAFDNQVTVVTFDAAEHTSLTYRDVVARLFAAFPDSVHGYHSVEEMPHYG